MAANASTVSLNQLRTRDLVGFQVLSRVFASLAEDESPQASAAARAETTFLEETLRENAEKESRWRHDAATWRGNVAVLLLITAALMAATVWAVRRTSPM
jgi:hypothetical protein